MLPFKRVKKSDGFPKELSEKTCKTIKTAYYGGFNNILLSSWFRFNGNSITGN